MRPAPGRMRHLTMPTAFIVAPLYGLAMFCRLFDQFVVDGLVDYYRNARNKDD